MNYMIIIGIPYRAHLLIVNSVLFIILLCSCKFGYVNLDNAETVYDKLSGEKVYLYVDHMPQYKDGEKRFLYDFSQYFNTQNKKEEYVGGLVRVQFVIDRYGRLKGERIVNKVNNLTITEKASLASLRRMQNWIPGVHNKQKVNVLVTMSININ